MQAQRWLSSMPGLFIACALATLSQAQQHRISSALTTVPKDPFIVNNGLVPTQSQYSGPLFQLSHDWPTSPLPPLNSPPWSQAIGGGPITVENAPGYAAALKAYVSPVARKLLLDPNFNAASDHWYTEPWLGSIRESIHGTYAAGQFGPEIFPHTGLKVTFDTHVLTYYDQRAAYTLFKVWSSDALNPAVETANFQFPEGSIVVKAAIFVSDNPKVQSDWWPVTNGAAKWPIFVGIPIPSSGPGPAPQVIDGYVMQFDIIVKDSVSAPRTGWVFSTLVYDRTAHGTDAWDKMVPLGAQWGNDPESNSSLQPPPPLKENWINPAAPLYATQTLGWGGRLTGPNDGGRNDIQVGNVVMKNAPDSSCMSCHSPSQWQPQQHKMVSFLLPSYSNPKPPPPFKPCGAGGVYICSPAPGSTDWLRWFQDRLGTQPMDAGSIATDFDMVFAFKTLPMWWLATGPSGAPAPFATSLVRGGHVQSQGFNEYSGAPLRPKK